MAEIFLNENAASFAAANWSDATGFADAAEMVVDRHSGVINTALDRSADTTDSSGGIKYIHFRCDTVDVGGESGTFSVEFDDTYTTRPNLVWAARGGRMRINSTGDTCKRAEFNGGGVCYLVGGDWEKVYVGSGTVIFGESATFSASAELICAGGRVVVEAHSSATDILPTTFVCGGQMELHRRPTTVNVSAGSLRMRSLDGAATTMNLYGGSTMLEAGNVPTLNVYGANGAVLDLSRAIREVTVGGTALNIAGKLDFRRYPTGGYVTISNEDAKVPIQS